MARSVADIQADLTLFYSLRTQAATDGIAEYSKDTGQGSQRVVRITLAEINKTIAALQGELSDADDSSSPGFVFDSEAW